MLRFTKQFIKNDTSKIVSDYKRPNDLEKLEEIRNRLHPNIKKEIKEEKLTNPNDINHIKRVESIKNINKL